MHISQTNLIEKGLDRIFGNAGLSLTWFKFSGTGTGLPEYGLGVSTTYYTSYVNAILGNHRPFASQLPGGFYEQGLIEVSVRETIGKDDMVDIGEIRYRVEGAPQQVILGPTLFYKTILRRSE